VKRPWPGVHVILQVGAAILRQCRHIPVSRPGAASTVLVASWSRGGSRRSRGTNDLLTKSPSSWQRWVSISARCRSG